MEKTVTTMEASTQTIINIPAAPDQENLPAAVVQDLSPSAGMNPERPSWMDDATDQSLRAKVGEFMEMVRRNPTDVRLSMEVYKLGEAGTKALMPHTALYDRKISGIMSMGGQESPINQNLLELKRTVDSVNPSVVEKLPIQVKVAMFFTRNRLPKAQEVLDMIYARRETVKSTIDGINQGLWQMKDDLISNMNDLVTIYNGLIGGQRLNEGDVYFGQMLHVEIAAFLAGIKDEIARQNIEQLLADLTSQIINLQTEENANMQFFAGAQALAKLTRQQIQNISGLSGLLQRTVLANLGLRVVVAELGRSLEVTEQLKRTIGDTIADTGKQINQYGDKLNEARSQSMISLEGLQRGCNELEEFFVKQAKANQLIIEEGQRTSHQLQAMTGRIRKRVEGGHGSLDVLKIEKSN